MFYTEVGMVGDVSTEDDKLAFYVGIGLSGSEFGKKHSPRVFNGNIHYYYTSA